MVDINKEKYYLQRFMHGDSDTIKDILGMTAEQFISLPDIDRARAMNNLPMQDYCAVKDSYFTYITSLAELEDIKKADHK